MATYTEEVGNKLNGLLEKNYDAVKGYQTASENAKSLVLTNFFKRKAQEREQFGNQLKTELEGLNQEPQSSGSFAGSAHRAWMNTKAFFTSDNDEAMLEEAIRGEKTALEDYNDVLNENNFLPQSVKELITTQRNAIVKDTMTIKKLEDIRE